MRFDQALENLVQASDYTRSSQPALAGQSVGIICDYSVSYGLGTASLEAIIKVLLAPRSVDQSVSSRLFKSLYPINAIPGNLIYFIVARLGSGEQKASYANQQAAIRWLTLVFDLIDRSTLSRCYAILFNLLDVFPLRAPLCHLLAQITRRKHIRPGRVRFLRHLEDGITSDAATTKLVDVFAFLAPEEFPQRKIKSSITFAHLNKQWAETLNEIRSQSATGPHSIPITVEDLRVTASGNKDRLASARMSSLEVSDIKGRNDFILRFEKLSMSHRSALDSADQTWQYLIALQSQGEEDPDAGLVLRGLCEEQKGLLEDEDRIDNDFLQTSLLYSRMNEGLPSAMLEFLEHYLPKWRPEINFEQEPTIFELLSFIPILPWDDLFTRFITPIESAILDTSLESMLKLLDLYTALLSNWALRLTLSSTISAQELTTVTKLQGHSSLLIKSILTYADAPSQLTASSILTHMEALLPLISPPISIVLPPPHPLFISTLLFASPTLSTISRTSTIIARYKKAFQHPPKSLTEAARSSTDVNTLNASLLDTCNLLLRSQAFNTTDPHAQGCLVPESLVSTLGKYTAAASMSKEIGIAFNLSCHPALASLSAIAFQELEQEAGREVRHVGLVSQKSLVTLGRMGGLKMGWREYRVHVLAWLEAVGVDGIGFLGRTAMRGLMGNEKGRDSLDARGLVT